MLTSHEPRVVLVWQVPYWALFGLLIRFLILKLHRLSTTFVVLLLLALPPWFAFALPQAYRPQEEFNLWYSVHQTGSLKTWTNGNPSSSHITPTPSPLPLTAHQHRSL